MRGSSIVPHGQAKVKTVNDGVFRRRLKAERQQFPNGESRPAGFEFGKPALPEIREALPVSQRGRRNQK
jgi:hypothetical protein